MTGLLEVLFVLVVLLLGLALAWVLLIAALDRFVLRHLALQPGMTVVDVGCGDGRLSLQMAKQVGPSGAVLGVDVRPWRVRRAAQRAQAAHAGQVHFTVATVGEGGISPLHSDRAVLVTVLGEMADPQAALAELFQALKRGERTLEAFYERLQPFAVPFMALFERDQLPARSTLSRFVLCNMGWYARSWHEVQGSPVALPQESPLCFSSCRFSLAFLP